MLPRSSAPGHSLRAGGHLVAQPPGCPSVTPFLPASQAQKDTGRGARCSLPPLPPPEQRRPGRLPSGCSVTQPRRRRLPCSSAGRDASRGRGSGRSAADREPLCVDPGTETPGTWCANPDRPSPCLLGTSAALFAVFSLSLEQGKQLKLQSRVVSSADTVRGGSQWKLMTKIRPGWGFH